MATLLITQWLKGIEGHWHRLYLLPQRRFRARLSGLLNHPLKHKLAVISQRHVGRVGGGDPRCVLSINAGYALEPKLRSNCVQSRLCTPSWRFSQFYQFYLASPGCQILSLTSSAIFDTLEKYVAHMIC